MFPCLKFYFPSPLIPVIPVFLIQSFCFHPRLYFLNPSISWSTPACGCVWWMRYCSMRNHKWISNKGTIAVVEGYHHYLSPSGPRFNPRLCQFSCLRFFLDFSSTVRQMLGKLRPHPSLDIITHHNHQSWPQWFSGYHTCHLIRVSGFKLGQGRWIFSERKNPEYDFLLKGSKSICPVL